MAGSLQSQKAFPANMLESLLIVKPPFLCVSQESVGTIFFSSLLMDNDKLINASGRFLILKMNISVRSSQPSGRDTQWACKLRDRMVPRAEVDNIHTCGCGWGGWGAGHTLSEEGTWSWDSNEEAAT